MAATTSKSPNAPNDRANSSPFNYGDLKNSLEHLSGFFSSPHAQNTKDLIDELDKQQHQLSKMRKTLEEQAENHNITVRQISSTLQQEMTKASDAEKKMKSKCTALEEKKNVISEYARKCKKLEGEIQHLQSANSQSEGKLAQASQDVSSLKEKLKTKNAIIEKSKTIESDLRRDLLVEKEKTEGLQKLVDDMQCKVAKMQGFSPRRQNMDEKTMMDSFDNLWEYAAARMSSILSHDLEPKALKDLSKWRIIGEESHRLAYHFPLPASNSSAAKAMRLVVILAVLSREIDKYIFQPAYLTPDDSNLRKTLSQLAGTDPEKETLYRSLTLSIDSKTQKGFLQSNVQTVVQKVSNCVFGLLSDSQYSEFREITKKIVKKAAEVWDPIQHSQRKYEPGFDLYDEHMPFIFPGQEKGRNRKGINVDSKRDVLMIFPGISSIGLGPRQQQSYVISLSKLHPLYVLADQEASSVPPSPSIDLAN
ncbi:hypothetical protein N7456_006181 [Penicillium angulare]|uniref:Uncharacterized protein n=1 Tax=Penicillium angulare TaxID=116970 RepID=A0A9W9FZX5_9EURO|nr:hypothetical protein N7456_006181 [Penicillium angulare]